MVIHNSVQLTKMRAGPLQPAANTSRAFANEISPSFLDLCPPLKRRCLLVKAQPALCWTTLRDNTMSVLTSQSHPEHGLSNLTNKSRGLATRSHDSLGPLGAQGAESARSHLPECPASTAQLYWTPSSKYSRPRHLGSARGTVSSCTAVETVCTVHSSTA